MRALILVLTLNEIENIQTLLCRIAVACPNTDVLVVDDDSPDGTAHRANQMAEDNPRIRVMIRKERPGLGNAMRVGLQYAVDHQFDLVVNLDADLSHAPEDIPRLIHAASCSDPQVDLVIGSRYIQGGRTSGWFWRWIVIKCSTNRRQLPTVTVLHTRTAKQDRKKARQECERHRPAAGKFFSKKGAFSLATRFSFALISKSGAISPNRSTQQSAECGNETTSQRLNVSTAQRLNGSTGSCTQSAVLAVLCTVYALGCDAGSPAVTGMTPANSIAGKSTTIDAGVVLHDRPGYLCLPLEQVGLKADDAIVSVASSCECIEPTLVQYVDSDGASKPAILLEHVAELPDVASNLDRQAMKLGVIISVELCSGKTYDFTVNLLSATLTSTALPSMVLP